MKRIPLTLSVWDVAHWRDIAQETRPHARNITDPVPVVHSPARCVAQSHGNYSRRCRYERFTYFARVRSWISAVSAQAAVGISTGGKFRLEAPRGTALEYNGVARLVRTGRRATVNGRRLGITLNSETVYLSKRELRTLVDQAVAAYVCNVLNGGV